jgi:secreted Zn-dependent insulinase-like peptidase
LSQSHGRNGVEFRVSGFSDKLKSLLFELVDKFVDGVFTEEHFERIRERYAACRATTSRTVLS